MKVVWTENAIRELGGIVEHLAKQSPEHADRVGNNLLDVSFSLKQDRSLAFEVEEWHAPTIRQVYVHPYRLIFRVGELDIRILSVCHAARQFVPPPVSD